MWKHFGIMFPTNMIQKHPIGPITINISNYNTIPIHISNYNTINTSN